MRIRPKISVRPTPRKNSRADCDSALTDCVNRRASVLIGKRPDACCLRLVLEGHGVAAGRRAVAWEGGDYLGHRRVEARLLDHLDHEALLHALVVALADVHLALDALDLDVLERGPQLGGL